MEDPVNRMIRECDRERGRILGSWRAAHASRSIAASLTGAVLLCAGCVLPDPDECDLAVVGEAERGSSELRIATSEDIARHGYCHSCGTDLLTVLAGRPPRH